MLSSFASEIQANSRGLGRTIIEQLFRVALPSLAIPLMDRLDLILNVHGLPHWWPRSVSFTIRIPIVGSGCFFSSGLLFLTDGLARDWIENIGSL
jgi:hypothetical protein